MLADDMETALMIAVVLGVHKRGHLSDVDTAKVRSIPDSIFARCEELERGYPLLSAEIKRAYVLDAGSN